MRLIRTKEEKAMQRSTKEVKVFSSLKVVESNDLASAVFPSDCTLSGVKLFYLILSQIKSSDKEMYKYSCSPVKLSKMMGIDSTEFSPSKIDEMIHSVNDLMINRGDNKVLHISPFRAWGTDDGGVKFFCLDESLAPYVMGALDKFTSFNVNMVLKLKSRYSILLSAYLMRYCFSDGREGNKNLTIEELRKVFTVKNKPSLALFDTLNRRVLLPSVEEINNTGYIHLEYVIEHGKYNKATGVKFTMSRIKK